MVYHSKDDINDRMKKIQAGDDREREILLEDYFPFVVSEVSKMTHAYVRTDDSEALSVGLEAFNHALDTYQPKQGTLIGFAKVVIRNRLIDEYRKKNKTMSVISLDALKDLPVNDDLERTALIRLEIDQYRKELKRYNIDFDDLPEQTPKHADVVKRLKILASNISADKDIMQEMLQTGKLPSRKIALKMNVSNKILRNHREFLIALIIGLESGGETLRHYMESEEK